MIRITLTLFLAVVLAAAFTSCAAPPDFSDEAKYYEVNPKTIIILPANNSTTDAEAPHLFMSTIGKPMIERGYYVMPVPLVADMMAREGIDLDGESWIIEPGMFLKHMGADAILYVTIKEWDTNYAVIASSVAVTLHYSLVDARTGALLWEKQGRKVVKGGGSAQHANSLGGLVAGLIVDTAHAAFTAAATDYVPLASEVNRTTLNGLYPGVYHADYDLMQKNIADWKKGK